ISMTRTREFDPNEVLEKAIPVFWEHGFSDTSIDDLVGATGVSRYGLYDAFGSKRGLFEAALDRYASEIGRELQGSLLNDDASLGDIEAYFERLIAMIEGSAVGRLGCMIGATGAELGPTDEAMAGRVRAHLASARKSMENALRNAEIKGLLKEGMDPEAGAAFLVTVLQGASVLTRSKCKAGGIASSLRLALSAVRK
ncbi:MAG: TetR/AcrR family transcriptional regulator, partial [Sphingomonadales bacterium]